MKALCWYGKGDVRVQTVPDRKIQDPTDAVVKITSSAIHSIDQGSDRREYGRGGMRGIYGK